MKITGIMLSALLAGVVGSTEIGEWHRYTSTDTAHVSKIDYQFTFVDMEPDEGRYCMKNVDDIYQISPDTKKDNRMIPLKTICFSVIKDKR